MTETRTSLISEGRVRAGRKGQGIPLTSQFDEITREMTRLYPILEGSDEGSTTAEQAYIVLPSDYRSKRFMIVNSSEMKWIDPDVYLRYIKTNTIVSTPPVKYTVIKEHWKIYLLSTPDAAYAYYFAYKKVHPRAGRQLAFTSGGTHVLLVGDTVTGATATGVISDIQLTSGTWAGGDAAGYFTFSAQTGTFTSENLNHGAVTNVATIAGNSSDADNYVHYLGDEFDEVIKAGLAWKVYDLTEEYDRGRGWRAEYYRTLAQKAGLTFKTAETMQSNFWGQMG